MKYGPCCALGVFALFGESRCRTSLELLEGRALEGPWPELCWVCWNDPWRGCAHPSGWAASLFFRIGRKEAWLAGYWEDHLLPPPADPLRVESRRGAEGQALHNLPRCVSVLPSLQIGMLSCRKGVREGGLQHLQGNPQLGQMLGGFLNVRFSCFFPCSVRNPKMMSLGAGIGILKCTFVCQDWNPKMFL